MSEQETKAEEAKEEGKEAEMELTDEEILSQIMLDMMTLKTLLIQKGVFKQDEFDKVSEKVAEEVTAMPENADASQPKE